MEALNLMHATMFCYNVYTEDGMNAARRLSVDFDNLHILNDSKMLPSVTSKPNNGSIVVGTMRQFN